MLDEEIKRLEKRTAYDEDVIGCFLCNYGSSRTCGDFRTSGCKDAAKCHRLQIVTEGERHDVM